MTKPTKKKTKQYTPARTSIIFDDPHGVKEALDASMEIKTTEAAANCASCGHGEIFHSGPGLKARCTHLEHVRSVDSMEVRVKQCTCAGFVSAWSPAPTASQVADYMQVNRSVGKSAWQKKWVLSSAFEDASVSRFQREVEQSNPANAVQCRCLHTKRSHLASNGICNIPACGCKAFEKYVAPEEIVRAAMAMPRTETKRIACSFHATRQGTCVCQW